MYILCNYMVKMFKNFLNSMWRFYHIFTQFVHHISLGNWSDFMYCIDVQTLRSECVHSTLTHWYPGVCTYVYTLGYQYIHSTFTHWYPSVCTYVHTLGYQCIHSTLTHWYPSVCTYVHTLGYQCIHSSL